MADPTHDDASHDATDADAADATSADGAELLADPDDELLVEEVSIDGMCGVY